MFERPHHRRIARLLEALDASLLRSNHCLFGGGTAMALRYGEYRESVDVDFLVSDIDGYRRLRQRMTGQNGIQSIVRPGQSLAQLREVRADQYGIRTIVEVEGMGIKFEIVLEGRVALAEPDAQHEICGIAVLSPLDMVAGKLLANSDRWADDSVFSRDLIDIAMMQPDQDLLARGRAKAMQAYGDSIERDLSKAIAKLLGKEGWLAVCLKAMQMTVPEALLRQRILDLQPAP